MQAAADVLGRVSSDAWIWAMGEPTMAFRSIVRVMPPRPTASTVGSSRRRGARIVLDVGSRMAVMGRHWIGWEE